MIGGMSWVSSRSYYEHINEAVQQRVGTMASASLLIESLDFTQLSKLESDEDWARAAEILGDSARRLERAGAGAIIIAANSMHRVYDEVSKAVNVPILHIADCVGAKMAADNCTSAAIIGTGNVMTEGFYRERLIDHGVSLIPPKFRNVETLNRIIYDELMLGKVTRDSQRTLKSIITVKEQEGAEAIVLACTELELIVDVDANVLPIYDSARIHCEAATDWLLSGDED